MNDSATFVQEGLGGLLAVHPHAEWNAQGFAITTEPASTPEGNPAVAVISGGGSGHEPLHAGFIGAGMLTAAVPGPLFTSPNAIQIQAATEAADQGRGVLHVVKNYTGDIMNFSVAARATDVEVATVVVADDVATDGQEDGPGRRGILGTMLVEKIAGAAAARGADLAEVARVAQDAADATRSMSVALHPGQLPTTGRDTFDLPEGQMEIGVGIHGERGVDRQDVQPATDIVDTMLSRITDALPDLSEDGAILIVSGLGGTTLLEVGLVTTAALRWLENKGIQVHRASAGTVVTAVNMHGVSVSVTQASKERLELIDAPTSAPFWPPAVRDPQSQVAESDIEDDVPADGPENAWLSGFVERVLGAIDDLSELDREAGDGDFGTNMDAALGGMSTPIRGDNADVLEALARRFFVRAGGTSGAVFGTLFQELAIAFRDSDDDTTALSEGLRAAVHAITELGGAEVGDNTMVDALAPAADAVASDGSFEDALATAHEAAADGALSTQEMTATKGRASYVGDASRGVVDPGAIVVSWLFGGDGKVSTFTEG